MTNRRRIFEDMGIEFRLNTEVGQDVSLQELIDGYDAVFLGVGTYQSMRAGLENEDASGVYDALPFLISNTYRVMSLKTDQPFIDMAGKKSGGPWWRRYRNGLCPDFGSSGCRQGDLCLSP